MSKKQFSNQLFILLLHLDVCDSLTFIHTSLYIQDSSNFTFSHFSRVIQHLLLLPPSLGSESHVYTA